MSWVCSHSPRAHRTYVLDLDCQVGGAERARDRGDLRRAGGLVSATAMLRDLVAGAMARKTCSLGCGEGRSVVGETCSGVARRSQSAQPRTCSKEKPSPTVAASTAQADG